MKFVAKDKKDQIVSSISLAGREYKADDGIIEVPDDHHEARKAAALIGLEHAPADEAPVKKPAKV
jgi:hypothetical protein